MVALFQKNSFVTPVYRVTFFCMFFVSSTSSPPYLYDNFQVSSTPKSTLGFLYESESASKADAYIMTRIL